MDRKIVKPAQEGGRIWSPEHGRFLPPEGIEVEMAPYWLHLVARKDVIAVAVPVAEEAPAPTDGTPHEDTATESASPPAV